MRLCFVADARSPIARNWIGYFIEGEHDVHVVSSYPCSPDVLAGATVYQVPIAFAGFARQGRNDSSSCVRGQSPTARLVAGLRSGPLSGLLMAGRHWLAPVELRRHVRTVRNLITKISPDLIHAMRIPFEGMLAAKATSSEFPLLISVWGNDFTLHAKHNPLIGQQTRQAMRRADALHSDCRRDLRLARLWGFGGDKQAVVLPGAGGIQTTRFHPGPCDPGVRERVQIPARAPVVINPRGFRPGSLRQDVFFKAIPHILQEWPEAIFLCSAMKSNPVAEQWVNKTATRRNVRLLPKVPRDQMADFFRLAWVTVSPSVHDGTPNSLLEAMACGCFPVAGDIESLREWITDGVNGLLCDPTSPESIAQAIVRALDDAELRQRARDLNVKLITQRAEYGKVMARAEQFYRQVIQSARSKRRVS